MYKEKYLYKESMASTSTICLSFLSMVMRKVAFFNVVEYNEYGAQLNSIENAAKIVDSDLLCINMVYSFAAWVLTARNEKKNT